MSDVSVTIEETTQEIHLTISPDKGDSSVSIYKVAATAPATPTGDNPTGWLAYPEAGINWMSSGVKTAGGVLVGTWSAPVRWTGQEATIEIGTVTTGAAGSDAEVSNSGTPTAAVLDFTIPQGDQGIQGIAATVEVGTVTTGAAGSAAEVSNSGTDKEAVLNFTIPQGIQGVQGIQGDAATIAVGTVTTGAAGSSASVSNSGTSGAAVFDFAIPRGDKGETGDPTTSTADTLGAGVVKQIPTIAGATVANAIGLGTYDAPTKAKLHIQLPIDKALSDAEVTQTLWNFDKAVKMPPNLLREIVEASSFGAATALHDDLGYPSMMYICKAINSGYIHTDFGPADAISSLYVVAGGSGYSVNDILTIDGKTGTAKVLTLGASGAVATVEVVNPGSGYTAGTKTTTVAPSGGSNCTLGVAIGGPIFPSHMVAGVFKPEIHLPMFNATKYGTGTAARAVVWPGLYPEGALTGGFNAEKALCTAKGTGWHMMTWWENAYLMWMSMKNGTEPRGNTLYGLSHESGYGYETAVRFDGLIQGTASGTAKHRNGSGVSKWNHNHERIGIADLVGNMWRRLDGMKINDGLIYLPDDNNYSLAEASWPAVHGSLSEAVYFDNSVAGSGGQPRLSSARDNALTDPNYSSVTHTSMAMTDGYNALDLTARRKMLRAGIATRLVQGTGVNPFAPKGTVFLRNYGERLPVVGGNWSSTSNAGLAALYLYYARSDAGSSIGFRPAFISP